MSEHKKIIPITSVPASKDAEAEIHGCAELEPYALRVLGDSMAPEFVEGHIIVVDPGLPAAHGTYVVADHDGETLFRQFWVEDGRRYLRPLNAAYPRVEIGGTFRLRGVVVQRAGRRHAERKRYY